MEKFIDVSDFNDELSEEKTCPLVYPTVESVVDLQEFMRNTFPDRYKAEYLYHFTKPDVVEKFLKEEADLRCSFFKGMNDDREWLLGIEYISEYLCSNGENTLAEAVYDFPNEVGCSPWICSFSQDDDKASMWGMYGDRHLGGYSVGFKRDDLAELVEEKNLHGNGDEYYLLPCLYRGRHDIDPVLDYILNTRYVDEDEHTFREGCGYEVPSRILSRIFFLSLIIKDFSFDYENEWRLIVRKHDIPPPIMNGPEVCWSGSPFIWSGIFKKHLRDYIKRIVVSPCGGSRIRKENFDRLNEQKSHLALDFTIDKSQSPYNGR